MNRRGLVTLAFLIAAAGSLGCAGCATTRETAGGVAPGRWPSGYVPADVSASTPDLVRAVTLGAPAGTDLWVRVRAGMKLNQQGSVKIDSQARWLAKDHRYLAKLAEGARPFLHVVLAEIERRGLPAELALLPQVESRFNPAATSPKLAAGMWQFMPATGAGMGLKQSAGYDGRRDLLESTRAALDYLEQLHRRLGGDWELAMAAYNCGPGRVESAQAANRARGLPTNFWELNLPGETQNYVPAILAIARLVATPERFGLLLPALPDGPQVELVIPEHPVELARVADAVQVNVQELRRLNAGLKQGRTDAGGKAGVLVPAGAGRHVGVKLPGARVMPAIVSTDGSRRRGPVVTAAVWSEEQPVGKELIYQVRKGETLGMVARRHGVSVEEIRGWNANASDGITEGETVRLYPRASWVGDGQALSLERPAPRADPKELDGFRPGGGLANAG